MKTRKRFKPYWFKYRIKQTLIAIRDGGDAGALRKYYGSWVRVAWALERLQAEQYFCKVMEGERWLDYRLELTEKGTKFLAS